MIIHGYTQQKRRRFKCKECGKTFVWRNTENKKNKEKIWFKLWVKESYSIRQISNISGHSISKLKRIKNYWLENVPDNIEIDSATKYLLFDGTYFNKKSCLALFINAVTKSTVLYEHIERESYYNVLPLLKKLKANGVNPVAITTDGHKQVLKAILEVWPNIITQRCLYHIQRQGNMWLRTYPKTEAGSELKKILLGLLLIKTKADKEKFLQTWVEWQKKYDAFIKKLPSNKVAYKDLKRVRTLIKNALPNMFHYLDDPNIPPTTNLLENFFSHLKPNYNRHKGLSEKHKIVYLKWYCFLKK